jgi:hypothetical protein
MTDNTIDALRVNQIGIEGVAAVGTQVWAVQPTAGKTFVIGGVTYTVVASGASVAGQINRGADLAAWKVNVVAAINGTVSPNTNPNPYASAGTFTGDNLPITARIPGVGGNSIVFTMPTPDSGNSVNGAGVLGGTTPGSNARGTAVASTQRLLVEQLVWDDAPERIYRPKVANGILFRNRGRATVTQHGAGFSGPDQAAIWDQFPLWFSMLFGAPVLSGAAGGPYTYTWTVDPSTNPNPLSGTLQRQFSNGLGNTIDERATYAMLDGFGLAFASGEELKLNFKGFARAFETTTITPGLTLADFEIGVSALSTIYFDDTFGAVGGTLLAEEVIGWKWDFIPGVFPRNTAEGRTTKDFTKHQINGNERASNLEIMCLLDPTLYAAEQTKANAGTPRAVRVKVVDSTTHSLTIDMLMEHAKTGLWAPTVDQGQDVVTFPMEESPDSTNAMVITLTTPDQYTLDPA